MHRRNVYLTAFLIAFGVLLAACFQTNPLPAGLTPIPSLNPAGAPTLDPDIQLVPTPVLAFDGNQAASGAALFELHCTVCHGSQGEGIDGPPLRNSQTIQVSTQSELVDLIANGVADTEMPAWLQNNGGPLTDQSITQIAYFLQTLQGVSKIEPVEMVEDEGESSGSSEAVPSEPALPSNDGEPGGAIDLDGDPVQGRALFGAICAACHGPQGRPETGAINPGSDDGVVPTLNPLDPSLIDSDFAVYKGNLDLFIEHGSLPEGEQPRIAMPAFGDSGILTEQQIADLIAYLIDLNPAGSAP
jgi:mono/diheme cytochrome c family protein